MKYKKVIIFLVTLVILINLASVSNWVRADEKYGIVSVNGVEMYKDTYGNLFPIIDEGNGRKYVQIGNYELAPLEALLERDAKESKGETFARDQEPIKLNTEFKLAFLSTPAYYCMEVSSIPLFNKRYNGDSYTSEINSYANLNDTEFKAFARKRIASLIQLEKTENRNFIWNKKFLEDSIRPLFPMMYSEIINNNNHRKITISGKVSSITLSGGEYHTQTNLIVYPKTLLGIELAEFDCRIYWSWNSTEILSVLPSTWGEVYAPGWNYKGIVSNMQYFYNNHRNFRKIVKGEFTYTYPISHLVRYYYPTLDITLYLGGDVMASNYGW